MDLREIGLMMGGGCT